MQTFEMLMAEDHLIFLRNNSQKTGITILKEKLLEPKYYMVELMCQDIGYIFIAGSMQGQQMAMKYMESLLDNRIEILKTVLNNK